MAKSLLKSLLLPGFVVSCTVFTGLIVMLASRPSTIALVGSSQQEANNLQQVSASEQRDKALRLVGLAIIISVASGIVTAAVLRKWQTFHETAQAKALKFGVDEAFLEPETAAINQSPEFFSSPSMIDDFSNHLIEEDAAIDANSDNALAEFSQLADRVESPLDHLLPIWGETSHTNANLPPLETEMALTALGDRNSSSLMPILYQPIDENLLVAPILESIQDYQYQRIKSADGQTRWFAILVDGQHYRLSKVEKTRENACKVAAKLTQLEMPTVITQIKRGYAIWTLEVNFIPEVPLA